MSEASAEVLRRQAQHLRELAREIVDECGQRALIELAKEYEARAAEAETGGGGVLPAD